MEKKNTVLDLFAGVGGLSVAFRNAGASIVCANDMDKKSNKIYRLNFPNVYFIDDAIQEIDNSTFPEVDIIVGGFPCQFISSINVRDGISIKGDDFKNIYQITTDNFENNHGRFFLNVDDERMEVSFLFKSICLESAKCFDIDSNYKEEQFFGFGIYN